MNLHSFDVALSPNKRARAVRIKNGTSLTGLAGALGLSEYRGSIAVVGGASGFDTVDFIDERKAVGLLLVELASVASKHHLAVIDGGTMAGNMQILGETRALRRGDFSLIGVVPEGCVTWYGRSTSWRERLQGLLHWLDFLNDAPEERAPLEPNHEAFVLVEGHHWGDEVETLARVAYALAGTQPSVEVLINGGTIARSDVAAFLKGSGHLIVVEGSGRFADELAAAYRHRTGSDSQIQALLASGRVHLFSLSSEPGVFRALLGELGGW